MKVKAHELKPKSKEELLNQVRHVCYCVFESAAGMPETRIVVTGCMYTNQLHVLV